MVNKRDIALVEELINQPAENSLVEFKRNNFKPETVGKLCSALSNAARIAQKDFSYVLWGIQDDSHEIVGTMFEPSKETVGNQVFEFWLSGRLNPSIAFEFRVIEHPNGRVVLLEIPAATSAPVSYENIPYVRIGSATPKLLDYPDRFQKLIDNMKPFTWEKAIAKSFVTADEVLELLDYPRYFKLTEQQLPENKKGILEGLNADLLIVKDVGENWNITNLGAILFANNLQRFDAAIARKGVRFIAYNGNNRAATVTHRQDGKKGYAIGFEGLVEYLNNLLPHNEHIGSVFREEQKLYPEIAIRELIANALIHQNMTIRGAGPQVELFADRLEITNPGRPLVHTDRMIDLPPRSRNDILASLMRRMKFCEEQGSGVDKVIISAELFQLPAPKFQAEESSMQVTLYAPRVFSQMSIDDRVRACYQHAVIKHLSGGKLKNISLCERFGIDPHKSPAQATKVINATLKANLIKPAEQDRPRAGYSPWWA